LADVVQHHESVRGDELQVGGDVGAHPGVGMVAIDEEDVH
jgi:hypothetical protein